MGFRKASVAYVGRVERLCIWRKMGFSLPEALRRGGECCLLLFIDVIGFLTSCQVQLKGLALMDNLVISFYLPVSLEEVYSLHLGETSLGFLLTSLLLPLD